MENKHDFRILIIDDNLDIHGDFIKILTSKKTASTELEDLGGAIFGEDSTKKNASALLPNFMIDPATQGKEGVLKIEQAISQDNP